MAGTQHHECIHERVRVVDAEDQGAITRQGLPTTDLKASIRCLRREIHRYTKHGIENVVILDFRHIYK